MQRISIKCTKNLTSCSSQYGRRWAPWSCTATRWARRVVCGGRARVGLTRSRKGHAYPPGPWLPSHRALSERRQQRPGFPTRRHPPEPEVHHQRHLAAERRGHRPTWCSGAPPSWGEGGTAGESDGIPCISKYRPNMVPDFVLVYKELPRSPFPMRTTRSPRTTRRSDLALGTLCVLLRDRGESRHRFRRIK